jgi:hypothetical protein
MPPDVTERSVDKHLTNKRASLRRIGKHVEEKKGQGLPMQHKKTERQEPRSLGEDRTDKLRKIPASIGP